MYSDEKLYDYVHQLIGRPTNSIINKKQCLDKFKNKTILVTGAGGSIGGALSKELLQFNPKKILILGNGENSIYEINQKLNEQNHNKETDIIPIIANIQHQEKISYIFNKFRPHIVFHVAAHKHVPLMESFPEEAVKNNVVGTKIVLDVATEYNVLDFILVSTDKAVNPTNVLGATKKIAEMLVQEKSLSYGGNLLSVRFGNVLGSRGSVLPLFQRQIESGGPVTVTSREIRRYFMSIPEAVQLTIQASCLETNGHTYYLNMKEQYNIYDLAKEKFENH